MSRKIDPDYFLALTLQRQFNDEHKKEKDMKRKVDPQPSCSFHDFASPVRKKQALPEKVNLNDSQWEVIDPTPDIYGLFVSFDKRFFQSRLGSVEVKWSKRMTSCAGVCRFKGRRDRSGRGIGEVTVSLSEPLLKLRPRSDLVNTLLHEMIHAYLFLFTEDVNRADRDDHGFEFKKHMNRINKEAGTNITIYHSFHQEVSLYKQHWWKCNGPCHKRGPFWGLVKRATNRAPGPSDFWYSSHRAECGGTFIKVKEPENFKARPRKNKENFNSNYPSTSTMTASTPSLFNKNKTIPTPGNSKIVGFKDLTSPPKKDVNKFQNPFKKDNPFKNIKSPPKNNNLGNNQFKLGGSSNGNKLGSPNTTYGGNRLGNSNNSFSNRTGSNDNSLGSYNLGSPIKLGGNKIGTNNRPEPIGTKLLDKLNFNNNNKKTETLGRNNNQLNNKTNSNVNKNNNPSTSYKNGSSGGYNKGNYSGVGGGTKMNKGSGTLVVTNNKTNDKLNDNSNKEPIKPINKLNLDTFKSFQGQGQTLGGTGGQNVNGNQSRLLTLGNTKSSVNKINDNKTSNKSNDRNNSSANKSNSSYSFKNNEYNDNKNTKSNKSSNDSNKTNNLDDSFEEYENMMNDNDIDVFANISDDFINNSQTINNNNLDDKINNIDDDDDDVNLDDLIDISSEEDMEDETNCPVCNKSIKRKNMSEHLEDNCLELTQVFDNVAIDDEYDEDENGDRDEIIIDNVVRNDNGEVNERGVININDEQQQQYVKCPICNKDVLETNINEHIDDCLAMNID